LNAEELVGIFENIIVSIDNKGDEKYYPLPPYQESKSWQELFPNRLNTFFGPKEMEEESGDEDDNFFPPPPPIISQGNWDILAQIYADWQKK